MRQSPRSVVSGLSIALAIVALAVSPDTADAQRVRISASTLAADSLTPEQVTDIDKFVTSLTGIISTSNNPTDIAAARRALLQPLNNTLTKPVPRGVLTEKIATRIASAIKSDSLPVRLNALIVASEAPHPAVGAMIVPGLKDESPAVRYWAAKACASVMAVRLGGTKVPFDDATQQQILDTINAMAPKEASDSVLDQMFQALASLTIGPARQALFGILGQRVGAHMPQANLGLLADVAALNKLHQKLVVDVANARDVGPALRDLTAVTARFLQVASRDIAAGKADAALKPALESVVDTAQKVFTLATNQLAPNMPRRPILSGKLSAAELQLAVSEWVGTAENPGLLTSSPLAIPHAKYAMSSKAAPAPAPATAP